MITTQADGTIIAYLNEAWEPVPRAEATLIKVRYPDGRIVFLRPKVG